MSSIKYPGVGQRQRKLKRLYGGGKKNERPSNQSKTKRRLKLSGQFRHRRARPNKG